MKRIVIKVILYICGIFCIVYPMYSKFLTYKSQSETIYDYKKEIQAMDEAVLEEKKKQSEEFNKENSIETVVVDPNDINENNQLESSYNFLELGELVGIISIPKIKIELPIYEGITVNNLTKGVAHMENTSLPNGSLNTHSILAGHTGISNAEIFDNLNELELGDEFYITFYGNVTKYKVVDEAIVLPDDTRSLKVEDGKCLITLVTCTPKTVNTHRLLVTGEKVIEEEKTEEEVAPDDEDKEDETIIEMPKKSDFELFIEFSKANIKTYIFILLIILLLILLNVISYIIKKIKEKRKKRKKE